MKNKYVTLIFIFLFFIISACSNSENKPIKQEKQSVLEQSNYLWSNDKEIRFLQLEGKNEELHGLMTISKFNYNTYNLSDTTIPLKGTKIGNKFSLQTGEGLSKIMISGKIEKNSIIINDNGTEFEFKKFTEEYYDQKIKEAKDRINANIKKGAEEKAEQYYYANNPNPTQNVKFIAAERKGDVMNVQVCAPSSPSKDGCIPENWFEVNLKNSQVIPQKSYEVFIPEQKTPHDVNQNTNQDITIEMSDENRSKAEQLAKEYYQKNRGEIYSVLRFYADHVENGIIIVRLFEVQPGHDVTVGWYGVDVNANEVDPNIFFKQ